MTAIAFFEFGTLRGPIMPGISSRGSFSPTHELIVSREGVHSLVISFSHIYSLLFSFSIHLPLIFAVCVLPFLSQPVQYQKTGDLTNVSDSKCLRLLSPYSNTEAVFLLLQACDSLRVLVRAVPNVGFLQWQLLLRFSNEASKVNIIFYEAPP